MGQFKPMVKMETTEPSVILKLKKGGTVKGFKNTKMHTAESGHKKMADGGALSALLGSPALVGRPAVNTPVRSPGKPSMAERRKAMMAKAAEKMPAKAKASERGMPEAAIKGVAPGGAPAGMKKGGKAEGGESPAMHKAEMKKMSKLEGELKSHEGKPASKAHKGLKTGGVVMGNGGGYKTGGVAMSNAGGYKTGGVAMSNAGGYCGGGSSKKGYATGGKVDSGHPVAMPQGNKKPSTPATQVNLSGVFKGGGQVKKKVANSAILAKGGSASQKAQTSSSKPKKMAEGGSFLNKAIAASKVPATALNTNTLYPQPGGPTPYGVAPSTSVETRPYVPPSQIPFEPAVSGARDNPKAALAKPPIYTPPKKPAAQPDKYAPKAANGLINGMTAEQYNLQQMGVKPTKNIYSPTSGLYGNYTPKISTGRR